MLPQPEYRKGVFCFPSCTAVFSPPVILNQRLLHNISINCRIGSRVTLGNYANKMSALSPASLFSSGSFLIRKSSAQQHHSFHSAKHYISVNAHSEPSSPVVYLYITVISHSPPLGRVQLQAGYRGISCTRPRVSHCNHSMPGFS